MSNYRLKYSFDFDDNKGKGYTKEEIEKFLLNGDDIGACDALLLVSIMKDKGEFNIQAVTFDPTTEDKEMSILDLFKTWASLAHTLSEHAPMVWQRNIANEVVEKVREIILNPKK